MAHMEITQLLGRVFTSVRGQIGASALTFTTVEGNHFELLQPGPLSEVLIEDICGDLGDLEDAPLLQAEEVSSETEDLSSDDPEYETYNTTSITWTFYKFATRKGYVTVRWRGISANGAYAENVELCAD